MHKTTNYSSQTKLTNLKFKHKKNILNKNSNGVWTRKVNDNTEIYGWHTPINQTQKYFLCYNFIRNRNCKRSKYCNWRHYDFKNGYDIKTKWRPHLFKFKNDI